MIHKPTACVRNGMMQRCYDKGSVSYKYYGARGITVDSKWFTYAGFVADMGERPTGTTLDRVDNERGYCKENCRWVTRKEQARNRSSNRVLELDGKTQCVSAWAEEAGIPQDRLLSRLKRYPNDLAKCLAPIKGLRASAVERFWLKVNKSDECWTWTGGVSVSGYGFHFHNEKVPAHRFSWELVNGPVPSESVLRHTCRDKTCVNPSHLYVAPWIRTKAKESIK